MNKVIIVGHSLLGVAEVAQQMQCLGMKPPLPSRSDGMLPNEITAALCRAHQTPSSDIPTRESDFQQIATGPVWHGMARDLLLGNQNQELWGWADTQSIFLLDYWSQLDPLMAFVLVYDEPQQALAEAASLDAGGPDEPCIQQRLDNWTAYNGVLLRFFLRHPGRCLLVNARQIPCARDQFFQQVRALVATAPAADDLGAAQGGPFAPVAAALQEALRITTCEPAGAMRALLAKTAESCMLDQLLADWPACTELFNELQASANLPLHRDQADASGIEPAWKSLVKQRRTACAIISQLHDERFLLMSQLHLAQEELEHLYLKNKVWKKPPPKTRKAAAPGALLGAADRVKQQLSYRLGYTVVKRSRSLGGWLGMPFALAGEILSNRGEPPKSSSKKLPPLHTYDDAKEAERVKNQLSYRIGNSLIKHSRSPLGWIKLPFALRREFRAFRKTRGNQQSSRPS